MNKGNVKHREAVITGVVLCLICAGTYLFLNGIENKTPGWSDSAIIQNKASSLSLLIDDGFWIAVEYDDEISIYYSEDGKKWSPQNPPADISGFPGYEDVQWLQRPNGDIWLVWHPDVSYREFWRFFYARLQEKEFAVPGSFHYLNERVIECSPGELTVLGVRYPSGKWMGLDVSKDADQCLVLDDGEWGLPGWYYLKPYSYGTIFSVDTYGTLWAVYTTKGKTYVSSSEDRKTWSTPYLLSRSKDTEFFQRQNGTYVHFFENGRSIYMISSPDGVTWSQPALVARESMGISLLDAGESDTELWVVYGAEHFIWEVVHVKKFTDEKFHQDLIRLQHYCTRNAVGALLFTLVLGAGWVLFRKRSYYPPLKLYIEKVRWNQEYDKKMEIIIIVSFLILYSTAFLFQMSSATYFVMAICLTATFAVYVLVEGRAENLFAVTAFFIAVLFFWVVALAECMNL